MLHMDKIFVVKEGEVGEEGLGTIVLTKDATYSRYD